MLYGWNDAKSKPPAPVCRSRKSFWKASVGGSCVILRSTPEADLILATWSSGRLAVISHRLTVLPLATPLSAVRMSSVVLICPPALVAALAGAEALVAAEADAAGFVEAAPDGLP